MTAIAPPRIARSESRYFHLYMAIAFVLIAFVGFTPSYWAKVASHSFDGPRILHLHGLILSSWTLFYLAQTALVANRRAQDHRAWGLAGISLFTLVICTILASQIAIIKLHEAEGFGDAARRFAAVTLLGVPLLIGFFAAAIVYVRRPEIHKRLMLLLMTCFMPPAIARMFIVILVPASTGPSAPPPPFFALPPSILANLLIVVAMVHDRRTLVRVSPVYVYGGLVIVAQELLVAPIARTDAWTAVAKAIESLAR